MALTTIDDRGLKTPIDLLDNEKIRFGTGNDLEVFHNGSASWIKDTGTGGLNILSNLLWLGNTGGTETFIQCTEDGSVELWYNGVKTFETTTDGVTVKGSEGGNAFLYVYADEGDDNGDKWRHLATVGGQYFLSNYASGGWEHNIGCTGNGAVELYYDNSKKLETVANGIKTEANLFLNDSTDGNTGRLKLGDGQDIQIYHTGSHSYLDHRNTGHLYIRANVGGDVDSNIIIQPLSGEHGIITKHNGASELYYDNSKKFETDSQGVSVTGAYYGSDWVKLQHDNKGFTSGASDDLQIYHDGTDSHIDNITGGLAIKDTGGYMRLKSDDLKLESATDEDYIACTANGAVELFHNNSKKLETTADGIFVKNSIKIEESSGSEYYLIATNSYGGLEFQNETTKIAEFTDANTLELQDNLKFAVDGKGINFGVAETGNATSSIFHDYEEGTWSGSLVANGNQSTLFGTTTGRYTKIGRMCTVSIKFDDVDCSGIDSGNYIQILGSPFTGINSNNVGDVSHNAFTSNVGFNDERKHFFKMQLNGSAWTGYESRHDNTSQPWYSQNWDSSSLTLFFTGHYTTNT